MKHLCAALLLILSLAMAACEGGGSLEEDAFSFIRVHDAQTGALLASGDEDPHGTLTMQVGDVTRLRVTRHVSDEDEGALTTNVTAEADYNSSATLVATVSQNGTENPGWITALSVGTTIIDVVFRDEGGVEGEDDHAFIDVTVVP